MNIIEQIDSYSSSKKNILACCNSSDDDYQLTYEDLINFSNSLAFYIDNNLKSDKSSIVVYGHKHPYMLVCFLACVKSGRPYIPIDISVPIERVRDIIDESKPPIIFATEQLSIGNKTIDLDRINYIINNTNEKINRSKYVSGEDIFYIIFTLGSTGKPKGVQITESCLRNFVNWAITLGGKNLRDKPLTFINQAPFSFDLSAMDLYMSLCLGGTLWCLDKTVQTDASLLMSSLKKSDANIWVSTPSFANLCLANSGFNKNLMPKLELFLFCG